MIQRRIFLQRVGSILAVLGLSETAWLSGEQRSLTALAQSKSSKFAVLVGINNYQYLPVLRGCTTDVSLQRELLIGRLGFERENILEIVDGNATRTAIAAALREYLPQRVKPGDVVVFHFSGYGTQVKSGGVLEAAENALIPVDGKVDGNFSNYLLEETILLLLRSLRTNQVIAIFDTSNHPLSANLPGSLPTRVCSIPARTTVSTEEIELRKSLKEQVVNDTQIITLRATNSLNSAAREIDLAGFSAGAFTYALTQYLWSANSGNSLQNCLTQVSSSLYGMGLNQEPMVDNLRKMKTTDVLADSGLKIVTQSAEGVIDGIEEDGKTCLVWLGGLPPQVINSYGISSLLEVVNIPQPYLLQLRSRNGLMAKAQNANPESTLIPALNALVQEYLRVIPHDLNLVVALNSQLERIERVDATSGVAGIAHTTTVVAGEQPADCVFGKVIEAGNDHNSPTGRYGLFNLAGELFPNTIGDSGEAVKQATKRLEPKLKALMAAKLWNQTENEVSSRLNIKATLEITNTVVPRPALQRQTRSQNNENNNRKTTTILDTGLKSSSSNLPTIPIGSRIQLRVENHNSVPVYVMLVGLDSNKDAIALFPWSISNDSPTGANQTKLQDIAIAPNQTSIIPQTPPGFEWTLQGLTAIWELQLLVSTQPWKHTINALNNENNPSRESPGVLTLNKPIAVSRALLQDIHDASLVTSQKYSLPSDHYAWDVKCWASIKFTFQVV